MNWNALEWDRAAEELTWERVSVPDQRCTFEALKPHIHLNKCHRSFQMLGLDGSLVFLVNVSLVVFILLCVFTHPLFYPAGACFLGGVAQHTLYSGLW